MTRLYWLPIIFLSLTAIAFYGCWADGDQYLMAHNHDNPYREAPWSYPAEFIAGPGFVVAVLIFNRTDIPERDPDSWTTSWLIAPSAAAIWIGVYLVISKAVCSLRRFVKNQSRNV